MTIEEWAKDFKSYVNWLDMHRDDYNGIMKYIDDAIALLKEQETIEPIDLGLSADFIACGCPICERWLDHDYKYCPYCGKKVKWK